ncbi:hypothetical protein F5887DRAFT_39668 [Amanita rubescens]|nr:hypothetical protein F5887DRAFT_39668 [Amanita rubescens]
MAYLAAFPTPSPYAVQCQMAPWHGSFRVVSNEMCASDRDSSQLVYVTAVETDGQSRMDLWPHQFVTYVKSNSTVLREFLAWVDQYHPPTCTYVPTKFPDANREAMNQSNFRALSRILFESQTIAIASWNIDAIPGAGIIIYPAQNSTVMLVGALFLHSSFPEFISGMSQSVHPNPYTMQWHAQIPYSQPMEYANGFHYPAYYPHRLACPENSNANNPFNRYRFFPEFVSGISQSVHPNPCMMQWHAQIPYSQSVGGGFHYPVCYPHQLASPENSNANGSPFDHYQYTIPQNMGWNPKQTQSFMGGTSGVLKTEDESTQQVTGPRYTLFINSSGTDD